MSAQLKEPGKCPFHHASGGGTSNKEWWPNALRLDLLHQHSELSNPMGEDFNYAEEFKKLDYWQLKKDLAAVMIDSLAMDVSFWGEHG